MRDLRELGQVAGIAALLVGTWLGASGVVQAEPASGLGVRLSIDCRGDLEVERYIHDALAREFAKVERVVLVEERELAGLYVYGSRTANQADSEGYVLSIAYTTRLSAEVILGAFSATEPSEQQLGMVAEMAEGASHLEHLESVYLADVFLFEHQGVAAAVVHDFERRALEPIWEILHEMLQPARPSQQDARPEYPLGLVREVSAGREGRVLPACEAGERGRPGALGSEEMPTRKIDAELAVGMGIEGAPPPDAFTGLTFL